MYIFIKRDVKKIRKRIDKSPPILKKSALENFLVSNQYSKPKPARIEREKMDKARILDGAPVDRIGIGRENKNVVIGDFKDKKIVNTNKDRKKNKILFFLIARKAKRTGIVPK